MLKSAGSKNLGHSNKAGTKAQLVGLKLQFDALHAEYLLKLNNFKMRYSSPTFKSQGWEAFFGFVKAMLPIDDSNHLKSSFWYSDLLVAIPDNFFNNLFKSYVLVGPGGGGQNSKLFSKLTGTETTVYFPNLIKDRMKILSGAIKGKLESADLEGLIKNNIDNFNKINPSSFIDEADNVAQSSADTIRSSFKKYKMPLEVINKKLDSKLIEKNSRIVQRTLGSVEDLGANGKFFKNFSKIAPVASKFTGKLPVVGAAISSITNGKEYYDADTNGGTKDERIVRATAAGPTTAGGGFLGGMAGGAATGAAIGSVFPGVGTAIGGIVGGVIGGVAGGWAGEQAVKSTNFDDFVADSFGTAYSEGKKFLGGLFH